MALVVSSLAFAGDAFRFLDFDSGSLVVDAAVAGAVLSSTDASSGIEGVIALLGGRLSVDCGTGIHWGSAVCEASSEAKEPKANALPLLDLSGRVAICEGGWVNVGSSCVCGG